MSDDFSLVGAVALVTGAVGALGSDIARALSRAGAAVAVHHLDQPDEATALAEELSAHGYGATVVSGDVTSPSDARTMVEATEAVLGPLTLLVNNAGIIDERPLLEMPLEVWQRTIDVDLTGVFVMCQAVLAGMQHRPGSSIVNVASQVPFKGGPNLASYAAAKGGVVGLTRALAREFGPGVRVNAIAPGPLTTPMTAPYTDDEEWVRARVANLVDQRLGDTAEVAPSVVFLASPAGRLYLGQTLHVNGGGVMA